MSALVKETSAGKDQTAGPAVKELAAKVTVYAVLIMAAIAVVFPVYYALAGSVMSTGDLTQAPPALTPSGVHLGNFADVFHAVPLGRQYLNSLVVAAVITVAQLVTSVLAAYAFVFLPLKWRKAVFGLFLATLMIPWEAIIIPNYQTISDSGLANTYFALVLPFLASAFGTFMLRQAFLQFPVELRDAARIDGSGHWRFLWRIVVPLSRPTLAAISVYAFLSAWNQYFWPLLVTDTPKMQTLQLGLSQLKNSESSDPRLILAGVAASIVPTLLLVVFGQRFIVKGLTAGAVK
jgi:sn-glycerol 3-phosphate transport system permease protein